MTNYRDEIREIGKRALEDWHLRMVRVFVEMGLLHDYELAPWIRDDEIIWKQSEGRIVALPKPSFDPIATDDDVLAAMARKRRAPLSHGARDLILE